MDNSFGYILGKLSSISTDKCLSYSLPVRTAFASYAIKYLVKFILKRYKDLNNKNDWLKLKLRTNGRTKISSIDLMTLGQCFAPVISTDHFDSLSASDFRNSIAYFQGITFQPNKNWITKISTKIE